MKTKLGKIKISNLKAAAGHSAAVLALVSASLISIPGLAQNFLFHLLGASEPIANFTTTSSTLSESAGANGVWPSALNGWTARRPIIVDGVSDSVSNFPLLLKLDSTKINYANTASLGADLRFAGPSGNLLQYEIESWDPNGTSLVWVKLQTLDAAPSRTVIWMYYGNGAVASAENASNVWSATQSKVLHLKGAAGSIANGAVISASVGLNASANNADGSGMAFAPGPIGSGVQLDGIDDWISVGPDVGLDFAASAPFTVSAYFRTTDSVGPLITFRDGATGNNVLGLYVGYNGSSLFPGRMNILIRDTTGGDFVEILGPIVNDGAWHHVAVTRNAGNLIELFVDGVSAGTASSGASGGAFTTDLRAIGVDRTWVLEGSSTLDQRYLDGTVDEVRVSRFQLPSSFFQADHLAYQDSLAYFLPEESPSQGTLPITVALNAAAISTVTIPYIVSGSATSGLDHNRASGNLVIASGASSGSLDLQVLKDQVVEPNETAILTLGAATGATIGNDFVHTVTITDEALAPPVAVDDTVNVTTLSPITIAVIANDTDANGDFLTITNVSVPNSGTAVRVGRSIRYTPSEDFSGVDGFTYTISDGRGGTDTANVTLNFQIPFTWTGLGANANWSTAENWLGNVAPGAANTAYFNDQCSVVCNPTLAVASIDMGGLRLNSSYSGTINQGATVLNIGANGFHQRGGTFTGGSTNITVDNLISITGGSFQSTSATLRLNTGNYTLSAPGTFTANGGTLYLACINGQVCNITPGVANYGNVIFAGQFAGFNLGGASMNVAGNLSAGDTYSSSNTTQPIDNGTILLSGNYNVINFGNRGSVVVKMVGNPAGQQINGSAGFFMPSLTIASGANEVTMNGDVNVANYFTYESGVLVTTGSTLWVHCEYKLTCPFTPGTIAYNNLRLSSQFGNYTLGGATVTVDGSLVIGDTYGVAYLNQQLNDGTFNVSGNISISPFGYRGNAVLNSLGGNSSISAGATVGVPEGTVTVDKNSKSDVLTFGSNLSFSGAGQAVTLTEGTVDLAGFNLGVSGLLTVGANAKLECNGGTVTADSTDIVGEVACGTSIGITWTGLGGDSLWSNPLNWTDSTVPTATDIAVFNSICGANCNATMDDTVNVRGIHMLQNYTGTITQGAGVTVAVGSAGWSIKSGTFTGSDADISITSNMSLYNGVFTAPSATLSLGNTECTPWKILLWATGGTFNHGNGRLKFNQSRPSSTACTGNYTIAVTAGFTVYDLEFAATTVNSGWLTTVGYETGFSAPIKVLRNFYDYGPTQNIHVDVEGDVYLANTNSPGTGILQLVGTGDQKINTAGTTPSQVMRINKVSGQVLPDTGVTNIWLYALDLVQGSFSAPTGMLTLGMTTNQSTTMNSLSIANGTSFATNAGTVRFALSRNGSLAVNTTANVVVPAGFEFANVEVTANPQAGSNHSVIASATPLIVAGNLVFGGDLNYANWRVRGDVSHVGTAPYGGTGSITLNGSTNQILSGVSTAKASSIIISSSGGTVSLAGTVVIWGDFSYASGIVDPGTSTVVFGAYGLTKNISPGTMSFNNVSFQGSTGTFNITGTVDVAGSTEIAGTSGSPHLMMNGGIVRARGSVALNSRGASGTTIVTAGGSGDQTITGGATARVPALAIDSNGGTVTLSGLIGINRGYEHLNGTVNASGSTLTFDASNATAAIIPGSTLFNNVNFAGFVATYNITGTLSTSGTMSVASVSGSPAQILNTGTLNPQAAFAFSSHGSTGTAPISFSGSTASSYTIGTSAQRPSGLVTVDKSGGAAVVLASNVSLVGGGQDLLINQGVLNLSGFNLSVIDGLTLSAGATLRCSGGDFTSASLTNSGTIECPGYPTYPFNWTGNAADGNFATAGNWQGGVSPTASDIVVFNSAYCGANCNSTILANASVRGIHLEAGYLGTLTQNAGASLTVGSNGWRQSNGTFIGGNQTILIGGVTNITGGTFTSTSGVLHTRSSVSRTATFNHNGGTWRISAPYNNTRAITLGNLDLNNVEFYSQVGFDSFTLTITGNVNVLGNLLLTRFDGSPPGSLNGGTFSVLGNITTNTNFYGSIGVRAAGNTNQTITGALAGSMIPNLTIMSTGGTVTVAGTPVFYRSLTHTSGSVNFGTSTVTLMGQFSTAYNIDVPLLSFNNLSIQSECNRDAVPFNITGNLNVFGNLQILASPCMASSINTGTIVVRGNVSTSGSFAYTGTAGLNLTGTGNATISQSGAGTFASGNITISKTAATVTQTTAISLPAAGQSLTVQSGTYNMAGFGLTAAGTVTNNSVLRRGTSPACGTITAGIYAGTAAICAP